MKKKILKSLLGIAMSAMMLIQAGGNLVFAETTASANGSYSVDLLDGQLYGDSIDGWTGHAAAFNAVLDTEESIDGGSSIRFNPSSGTYWFNVDLDAAKYGIASGDVLDLSGWVKRSEDYTMTQSGQSSPNLLLNNVIIWTFHYTDANGESQSSSHWYRNSDTFLLKDTSDWQFANQYYTIGESYVPADATLTKINVMMGFGVGYGQTLTGNMWFDRFQIKKAAANSGKLNVIPTTFRDEAGATNSIVSATNAQNPGFEGGELTQEEVKVGTNAFKFTGQGQYLVSSGGASDKLTFDSPTVKLKTAFWIKLSEEYIAAYPNPSLWIYHYTYYSQDANNIPSSGWDKYEVPSTGATLKATTDWQYVDATITHTFAQDEAVAGEPVYILQDTPIVRLQAWDAGTVTIPEGSAVYVDDFKFTYAPSDASVYSTQLTELFKVTKNGKQGMRALFNDNLITEGQVENAQYIVNGETCTDYTYEMLGNNGFEIYPTNAGEIESFKIKGLTNYFGGDVDIPISTTDYYSVDLADGQLFGDSIDVWDAKWGNGFTPTLDSTESVDGGTSVKLANPVDAEGNPVAKSWWYAANINGEEYDIKGGDSLTISGWIKYGEGFTMTESGAAAPAFASNNGVQYGITYIDPTTGEEATYGNIWRGANYFNTTETSEWQYVSSTVAIPSDVPTGAAITNIEIMGIFGSGYAYALTGDIWFDQWKVTRAYPDARNMIPAVWDHETGATNTICANPTSDTEPGFTTAELTQEEVLIGDYAYKFAGEGQYILNAGSMQYKKTFDSPTVNLRNSFWIKLPQEYLDLYPNPSLWIYNNTYYAQDATNIPESGWDKFQVPSAGVALQATTDWQFVDYTQEFTFAQDEAYVGQPIYIMQTRPNIRLQAYDAGKITIPEGTAIYADDYKFTFVTEAEYKYDTKLKSLTAVTKDDKNGVKAMFNDAVVSETEALQATYIVNGEVCTDYTINALSDNAFEIYPNVEWIESLEIQDMTSMWGDTIATNIEYIGEEQPEPEPEPEILDNVSITNVTVTEDTLKFITKANLKDGVSIVTFGTTLIPLWLFDNAEAETAVAEYDNANYDIQDGQTYSATLTGIPESCKDMQIVAKSYLNRLNDEYIWSNAKSASVNEASLADVAE